MTDTQPSTHTNGQMRCSKCGDFFFCGITHGGDSCWCFMLPRVMPLDGQAGATGCLCPECLRAAIQKQQSPGQYFASSRKPHA